MLSSAWFLRSLVLRLLAEKNIKCGPETVPFGGLFLRCRCARTELITSDLICPSTYQLLWNSGGDFRPDLSFNKSASSKRTHFTQLVSGPVDKCNDDLRPAAVLSGLSHIWKSHVCDLVLWGANGNGTGVGFDCFVLCPWPLLLEFVIVFLFCSYGLPFCCTPPAAAEAVIPNPTSEDLAVGTPSFKIVAKAEASQKRKASTFGVASSHVAKRTRSALAQSSGSTTLPSLFVGDDDESDDDDDDACVEIQLALTPKVKGPTMIDEEIAPPSSGMSRPRPSSGPAPSFKDVSDDSIHMNFFLFATGPYYATYPEGGVVGNCEFTREDVLHCMMMSHGGELLARYHGLDQSHHEYVLSADSRLKGYEEKVANMTGLELQVAALKKQVSRLNDKLTSSDASFAKSKAKGKERKKKIKSLGKSLDNLHYEVARLFVVLNQATILEAERDEEILRLKDTPPEFSSFFRGQFQGLVRKFLASDEFSGVQGELLSLAASVRFEHGLSMHRTKDEFDAVLNKMVNFMPGVHGGGEHNEDMVNAEDDESDPKMTDDTAAVKSGHAFMQGDGYVDSLIAAGEEAVRGAWYAGEHLLLRAWGKLSVDVLLSIQRILILSTTLLFIGVPCSEEGITVSPPPALC
ncbi:hypothetical protein Tco_0499517 [Tanacetum coccineum]